jgi:2'-5' RNA ligase
MRFWVGIIPPKKISKELYRTQKEIAKKYKTCHSLESRIGPHITITYQENVDKKDLKGIEKIVHEVSKKTEPFKIIIKGVGRFYRLSVIYFKVAKSKELKNLSNELSKRITRFSKIRRLRIFTPHITLADTDITKENFREAFKELGNKDFSYTFIVDRLFIGKSENERIKVYKSFKV